MMDKIIFSCNFYDLLIEKILNNLTNFIKYNPDDLNKKILEKVIKRAISEISNKPIEDIDKSFDHYAKIRIYFDCMKGAFLYTDNFNIFLPNLQSDKNDDIEAENCYLKAYFSKLYDLLSLKDRFKGFINLNPSDKLKAILNECSKYATSAAIYKISKNKSPNKDEIENFMKEQ